MPQIINPIRTPVLQSANTQTTTVSGTTETSLFPAGVGTKVIPANWFQPGWTTRLIMRGTITTPLVAGTTTIRAKINGSTAVSASTTSLLGSLTGSSFYCALHLQCYSAGSSGTIGIAGEVRYPVGLAGLQIGALPMVNTGYSLNTTIDNTLDITAQHSLTGHSISVVIQTLEAVPQSNTM